GAVINSQQHPCVLDAAQCGFVSECGEVLPSLPGSYEFSACLHSSTSSSHAASSPSRRASRCGEEEPSDAGIAQMTLTSVPGETSVNTCSALIRAESVAKAESRNTTRSGFRAASEAARAGVTSFAKQASNTLPSTLNTSRPSISSRAMGRLNSR